MMGLTCETPFMNEPAQRFIWKTMPSAQPVFIEYIRKHTDSYYAHFPYPITHAQIVQCRFLNDANLYGAFQCFVKNVNLSF